MLDDQDTADADQQELRNFLSLQQGEAVIAAKRKRERSPLPVAGPSSKKVQSDGSKKRSRRRSMAASTSTPVPPRTSSSLMEVPSRDLLMQGPSDLVQLATVAEAHSGLVRQAVSPPSARMPIKAHALGLHSAARYSNDLRLL
ncbi:hypothetical protein EV359DRAFT_88374 [Lentinula novae-zelandiae]|nr:hypothetical protein EV359DRAFT_88374 [Lentinula novae-zelandiae]